MDLYTTRGLLKNKSVYDLPLRVTYYARVSTDSVEQLNSLENQKDFYEKKIRSIKNWTFVKGYIDEGISGISTAKRESFLRMIDNAAEGKFDLILTKEISRFARNTVDGIKYTRDLLNMGVAVIFENDNINTLDPDSELRLTIMLGIAQDELRKLSSRITFGHAQSIKNGVVMGNSSIWGYNKCNKRLVIDEEEAKIVRKLFELYATDEYSMKQIENIFWNDGIRNRKGNRLSHTTMSNTIQNPKYKGYYVGNKVKVVDMFTKKQKFLPPEEWIMYKDETGNIVPQIVDEDLWERANQIFKRRSDDVKNRHNKSNHQHLFTGKLICGCCGAPYYFRSVGLSGGVTDELWVCSGKITNGASSCDSFVIHERELVPVLANIFVDTQDDYRKYIDQYLETYKKVAASNDLGARIDEFQKQLDFNKKKKQKLLGYNVSGTMSDSDFISFNKAIDADDKRISQNILELQAQQQNGKSFEDTVNDMRKTFSEAVREARSGIISPRFVKQYIDKIVITPDSEKLKTTITVCMFGGNQITETLENTILRSGHTSKKICPVRSMNSWSYDRITKNGKTRVTYSGCISL